MIIYRISICPRGFNGSLSFLLTTDNPALIDYYMREAFPNTNFWYEEEAGGA